MTFFEGYDTNDPNFVNMMRNLDQADAGLQELIQLMGSGEFFRELFNILDMLQETEDTSTKITLMFAVSGLRHFIHGVLDNE